MIRAHVTVANQNQQVMGANLQSAMKTDDGNYRAVVEIDSDDQEYVEECLDADANVIDYNV